MNRLTHLSEKKDLFVIIPGFMGDFESEFLSDIRETLTKQNCDYWTWNFKGYAKENAILGSISELIFQTKKELEIIRTLFPEKNLYFITYSQGAYIMARVFNELNYSYPTIMLTPALDLTNIILQRLDGDEADKIQTDRQILKTFKNGKSRILNTKWYTEYKDIPTNFQTPTNKFISIWGEQDFIVGQKDKNILDRILENKAIYLNGDHTFSGDFRTNFLLEMIKIIKSLI